MATDQPWPAALPDCAQTWTERDRPSTIRTDMDTGPPKVRRRFTAVMREATVGMIIASDQYEALRDFYEIECGEGTVFHTFRHPWSNVVTRFRFVQPPEFSNEGALAINVSMVWEQLPYA